MKVARSEQEVAFRENEDRLKRQNETLAKKINARQEEIKTIEELYDKKADMAILEGEDQYARALDRNSQRIVGISKDFEDKIKAYKDRLKDTQVMVEKEEATLRSSEDEKIKGLKRNFAENYEEKFQSALEDQRNIQFNTKSSVDNIAAQAMNEQRAMEARTTVEMNALTEHFNQKVGNADTDYRRKLENDLRKHQMDLSRQKEDLNRQMLEDTGRLKRVGTEKTRIQQDQLSLMDKHQQNMVKQRTDDFRARYEKMVNEHESIIKELESKLAADMKKMVEKSANDKTLFINKLDDRFYQVEKLNPIVTETPDSVEVALEIPPHEKENFHLSAQGRNIKMTLSRKFTDTLTTPDGSLNKSTRSELFSKEVLTKDILNSNKITQKYDQGVLTYKIAKA